jgi:hypothetical protein
MPRPVLYLLTWLVAASLPAQELGFQIGAAAHGFSTIRYQGYRTAAVTMFFPKTLGTFWGGDLGLELRGSRHWGTDVPILQDQATPEEWQAFQDAGESPHIDFDSWMVAAMPVWRRSLGTVADLEAGFGLSWMTPEVITGGTKWNFIMLLGLSREVGSWRDGPIRVGLRMEHFSNGGTLGLTDARVIGLESLQGVVSWRFR